MASNPVRRRPPERAPSYDWNTHGQQKMLQYGTYIFKPTVNVMVRRPTWKGTETIFRPYPSLDYVDPTKFEPYRLDAGGTAKMSNWIRRYDAAFMVGNPAITFLTEHPDLGNSYDPSTTPLGILNSAIRSAIKNRQEQPGFGALINGEAGKGAQLERVNSVYLMQGLLMVHNSELQYGQGKVPPGAGDRAPCCLMLKGGTGGSQYSLGPKLVSILDEENPDFNGDPEDFENRYLHGDVVSMETGRYLRFFQQGADPRNRYQAQPQARGAFSVQQQQQVGGGNSKEIAGYDIHIEQFLQDGTPACLNTEEWFDTVRSKWLYWEEALYFPTYLEQAHMLNGSFPASAIVYAFENYNKDWITEETWNKFLQRESASVPAAPPGHGSMPGIPGQRHTPQPPPPPAGYQPQERGFNTPTRQASPAQPPERRAVPMTSARQAAPGFGAPTGEIVDHNENGYPGEAQAFGGVPTARRGVPDDGSFDAGLADIPTEYSASPSQDEEEVINATVTPPQPGPAPARRAAPARNAEPGTPPTTAVPTARGGARDVAAPTAGIPDTPETSARPTVELTPAQKAAARLAARSRT
jgi:hypothetical protein